MKPVLASAVAIGVIAGCTYAGTRTTDRVRLEVRLVGVSGTPGVALVKTDSGAHQSLGMPLRFEVQYRIVDLDTSDAIEPAGLTSGNLRITVTSGTLSRAVLTRNQAGGGAGTPPVSTSINLDTDRSPLASNGAMGLHRPFRTGIPGPAPNNDNPANGVFESGNRVIRGITPLTLSQSDQNDGGWYGLYSFIYTTEGMTAVLHASFDADSLTGNRFGFFGDGDPVPFTSPVATSDSAVIDFPSPSSAWLLLVGMGWTARRRRTSTSPSREHTAIP